MADPSLLLESFKCHVCLDYATDAVETVCCHQINCMECLEPLLNGPCPCCKTDELVYRYSLLARRLIETIPVPCPNACGKPPTHGELQTHLKTCEKQPHTCPVDKCEFTGVSVEFVDHLLRNHRQFLVQKCVEPGEEAMERWDVVDCPFFRCRDSELLPDELHTHVEEEHAQQIQELYDRYNGRELPYHFNAEEKAVINKLNNICIVSDTEPVWIKNFDGDPVKMGRNGKFYCGKETAPLFSRDQPYCYSVKLQTCEYPNLNCVACMKFDVIIRDLPIARLVNSAGRPTATNPCTHVKTFFTKEPIPPLCEWNRCDRNPTFTCSVCEKMRRKPDRSYSSSDHCGACGLINSLMEERNGSVYQGSYMS